MSLCKTEMIREIIKENFQYTNRQIKDRIWARYGVRVGSNEVINAVGSEKKRYSYGRTPEYILKAGEEFIRKCGNYDQARRILALCGQS